MPKSRLVECPWVAMGYSEWVTLSEKWQLNDKLFRFTPWTRAFTLDRAFRGIKIYGATGSGKSSGFARVIGSSYLDHGFGGLVLCAKGSDDELNNWKEMAAEQERSRSLIHFGPKNREHKLCFNILEFVRTLTDNKDESQANIVKVLRLISSNFHGGKFSQTDTFWDGVTDQYLTHLVTLTMAANKNQPLTFIALNRAFKSIEAKMIEEMLDPSDQLSLDLKKALQFFTEDFPKLNDKTRSIIVAAVSSLLFKFDTGLLRDLFGGVGNIDPRWTFGGAVIVVNVPTLEFQEVGRIANMIWKYAFQKACTARQQHRYMRPVFLLADEAQEFVHPDDAKFQAVARSARCSTVYLTQNIAGLRLNLGQYQSHDTFKALESNLLTAIFHQNVDLETNEYASKILGTKKIKVKSTQTKGFLSTEVTESTTEKEVPLFNAESFVELKSGGHSNRKIVEAIVYSPGAKLSFDWINWRFQDWTKFRVKQGHYRRLQQPSVGKFEPDFTEVSGI